jgi:hypothetical protein
VVAATLLSTWSVARRLRRMDLAAILNARQVDRLGRYLLAWFPMILIAVANGALREAALVARWAITPRGRFPR